MSIQFGDVPNWLQGIGAMVGAVPGLMAFRRAWMVDFAHLGSSSGPSLN